MAEITVTKNNFEAEILNSDKPVIADFWATWCGPCKMLAPVLEEVASENPGIKVAKINIDEEPELAMEFRIVSIPTVMLFEGGKAVKTLVGYRTKEQLVQELGI